MEEKRTLCDRCGKPDHGEHTSPWLRLEAKWNTYRFGYGLHRHIENKVLCRECAKLFWSLLDGGLVTKE